MASSGSFEILVNVIAQRLERRDIEDAGLVRQAEGGALVDQFVDGVQECRQCLAGTRGCGNQRMPAGTDRSHAWVWHSEGAAKRLSNQPETA
jgi:hypothetical protein